MYIWNMKALPLLVRKLWPWLKFFKSRSNVKVKVTRSKILVPMERSCHKECTYEIWKPYLFWLGSYGQGLSFLKVGQTSRSRSQGQNFWYPWKGLVTRNIHVKYESSTYSSSWVIGKVKVFVHAHAHANAHAHAHAGGTTIALRTFVPAS